MKSKLLFFVLLLISNITLAQHVPAVKINNQVRQLSELSGEIVSQVRLAKAYFMTSKDPSAGDTFEERTANLSKRVNTIFQSFRDIRVPEYKNVSFQFSGSDWATGHHATKTVTIPANTYIFSKIQRTTSGDWKGGPVINGINRKTWFEGDIEGGNVTWTTGGHGRATTNWTVQARYSEQYANSTVENEIIELKKQLNAPTTTGNTKE